jgi:DNA segregation ATPase FtsK/SpoIIIE, S-DNA-T family
VELDVVVADGTGRRTAVTLTADASATVADVADALRVGAGLAGDQLFAGERRLEPSLTLAECGLLPGALLGLDGPVAEGPTGLDDGPVPERPTGGPGALQLAVVGGPYGGACAEAPAGRTLRIGRAPDGGLRLADPAVSRTHASLAVRADGRTAELTDHGSRNGVGWVGYRLDGTAEVHPGDTLQLGDTVLELRDPPGPVHALDRDPSAAVRRYNRRPRIPVPSALPEFTVPAEPERPRNRRFPLAAVLLPLLFALGLFLLMDSPGYWLAFVLLSPLMLIANAVSDARGGRREYRAKKAAYEVAMAELDACLAAVVADDERASRHAFPDPAAVVAFATAPTGRLWERRPADDDFLQLRAGLHDRPPAVLLRYERGAPAPDDGPPRARSVPLVVDVPGAGVVGVAGPRPALLACARALLAQAAALHAPADLGVLVVTGRDEAADWEWCTWLPHTEPHPDLVAPDTAPRRLIATDAGQAEARLAELRDLVERRGAERRAVLADGAPAGRRLLVVLDGARRLRALPGLTDLLRDGPPVGVYALCLDGDAAALPGECRATVEIGGAAAARATVRRPGREPVEGVLCDGLLPEHADRLARSLTGVRMLGGAADAAALPETVRWLDVAGTGTGTGMGLAGVDGAPGAEPAGAGEPSGARAGISAAGVRAAWARAPRGRSTRAVLGTGPAGPIEIDLTRDGPHALVAGTSGAGKSELLQTLVAALAAGAMPDALTFVLVDYKGGSAFAECRELPHCVGMVTDLDGHLAERALASLRAELRRRERVLAEAGAKDIEDYWARTDGRLPRLVIVVDEFATLAEEVPGFVRGVVDIGMRGRSLGVHVVLATQRPAGVVSAEIRANVNLRICLRVTSPADSADVIDAPDASRIAKRTPGRAYLRTGHQELTVFQAARVGGPRPDTSTGPAAHPTTAVPRVVTALGTPRPPRQTPGDAPAGPTDLTDIVAAVASAAHELGLRRQPSPWLPPLPEQVTVAELAGWQRTNGTGKGEGNGDEVTGEAAPLGAAEPTGGDGHAGGTGPASDAGPTGAAGTAGAGAAGKAGAGAAGKAGATGATGTAGTAGAGAAGTAGATGAADAADAGKAGAAGTAGATGAARHASDVVGPTAALGLADRPDRQAQEPFVLDLMDTGPVLVAGAPRSGRSTVLRTLAAALARGTSWADLHLYALDCGNLALAPLADLPHCGAVVSGDDTARTARLLRLLSAEVSRRQRELAEAGFASLQEQRRARPDAALPYVVLLLDRMEGFTARYAEFDGGRLVEEVEALLRVGPAVGVFTVVSADRTGFTPRMGSALGARLVLAQADRDDYAVFGLNPRAVPARMPPGRALWTAAGTADGALEVQLALLDPDPAGAAQAAAVRTVAQEARRRWAAAPRRSRPRRVDALPERITLAAARDLREAPAPRGDAVCVVGVGGDELAPLEVDLAGDGPCFVVAGRPRSGRSTALACVVRSLRGRESGGLPVLVIAPRPSPLRDLAGLPGVVDVLEGGPDLAAEIEDVLAEHPGPLAVVVDDAELVEDRHADAVLERVVKGARDEHRVVVAAATTDDLLSSRFRGWLGAARRSRAGLLLSPASHIDGEVFDLRLPRSTSGGGPAGRGLLALRGHAEPVQVAQP